MLIEPELAENCFSFAVFKFISCVKLSSKKRLCEICLISEENCAEGTFDPTCYKQMTLRAQRIFSILDIAIKPVGLNNQKQKIVYIKIEVLFVSITCKMCCACLHGNNQNELPAQKLFEALS